MTRSLNIKRYPEEYYKLFEHLSNTGLPVELGPIRTENQAQTLRLSLYTFLKALDRAQPATAMRYRQSAIIRLERRNEAFYICLTPSEASSTAERMRSLITGALGVPEAPPKAPPTPEAPTPAEADAEAFINALFGIPPGPGPGPDDSDNGDDSDAN